MLDVKAISILLEGVSSLIPDLRCIYLLDQQGSILFSQPFGLPIGQISNEISSTLQTMIHRIQDHTVKDRFSSMVFDTETYRLLLIKADNWSFIFQLDINASVDDLYPYIFLTTEKLYRIMEGQSNITLSVPKLGISSSVFPPSGKSVVFSSKETANRWLFKYTLLGDSGVGKTSVVNRFVEGTFAKDFRPTIGLNVMAHQYQFLGMQINASIYDIGSQAFFKRVRRYYYTGTNAALLVFALNDRDSFNALPKWKEELEQYCGNKLPACIIGNKNDLPRAISFEEALSFAQAMNATYIETSALNGANIQELFTLIAYQLIRTHAEFIINPSQ